MNGWYGIWRRFMSCHRRPTMPASAGRDGSLALTRALRGNDYRCQPPMATARFWSTAMSKRW